MRDLTVKSVLLVALFMIAGLSVAGTVAIPDAVSTESNLAVTTSSSLDKVSFVWNTGVVETSNTEDGLEKAYSIQCDRSLATHEETPTAGGLVRLPWGHSASVNLVSGRMLKYNSSNELIGSQDLTDSRFNDHEVVVLGDAAVMRDITVAPLQVKPIVKDNDGSFWVAQNLEFDVVAGEKLENLQASQSQKPVSRAFWPIYQSTVLNDLDDLGVRLAETKGSYLVVAANSYMTSNSLTDFIEWKEKKGYNVVVHSYDQAPSFSVLKSAIADYYNDLEPQLEYVLLVGDENRGVSTAIPAERIQNPGHPTENDVTDWPYTFIEGDDYFPEVFIGRMTVETQSEAYKASTRVIKYETNAGNIAYDHEYWHSATLVAANYSDGGLPPLTPVATTEWLYERMRENWGLWSSDLLPWQAGGQQSTSQEVTNSINAGALFVTYRGWGNARGWAQPEFNVNDVDDLNNRNMLPVVTSFVCNTGDFGNDVYTQCFGERWITAGTGASPKGAVAVVAPSDLHTKTKFNNALLTGFYTGLYEEGISNISQALFRGKNELFLGFPNERSRGSYVEFYYHVYHVLGDPELTVWKKRPFDLTVNAPESIALGQDYLEVDVEGQWGNIKNAYVQVIQGEEVFVGRYTDGSGKAIIPIIGAVEGDLGLTITYPGGLPVEKTVAVSQSDSHVGVVSWSITGDDNHISPGETVGFEVSLKNFGASALTGVNATISNENTELVTISSSDASFGDIAVDGEATNSSSPFEFTLNSGVPEGSVLEFNINIQDGSSGSWAGKVWLPVGELNLQYEGFELASGDEFAPGSQADITVNLTNYGEISETDLSATLISWDESVVVSSADADIASVPMGDEVAVGPFTVDVNSGTFGGRLINFAMEIRSGSTVVDALHFSIELEGASASDPLGPDAYGYYAYDDTDSEWEQAPTYTWFDLENVDGAQLHDLDDDDNVHIDLPFDFKFYGEDFEEGSTITVSSSGWLSLFEEEDYTSNFFRNWHVPSTLGPHTLIAPFWDDLKPPVGGRIHVYTYYDEAAGKLIIEWANTKNRFGYETIRYPAVFAVVLYDQTAMPTTTGDGVMEFMYNDVINIDENNNYATVGIENSHHTIGLEYTYAQNYPAAAAPLENERAIRLTTEAPDDFNGVSDDPESLLSKDFALMPCYPNPFNSTTKIRFNLVDNGNVRLSVYNLLGQEVAVILDQNMKAGLNEVLWEVGSGELSSGLFFVKLQSNEGSLWQKVMFVK